MLCINYLSNVKIDANKSYVADILSYFKRLDLDMKNKVSY